MDFSELDRTEKTAAMASAVLVVAGLIAAGAYATYSMTWLAVIAAVGMLFVVLQPQIAAGVTLPGSRGSLMLLLGVAAGVIMVASLLVGLDFVFLRFGLPDLAFLIALAAGATMAWAGWRQLQAEGGKLQLGATATGATARAPIDDAAIEASAPSPSSVDADVDRPREP